MVRLHLSGPLGGARPDSFRAARSGRVRRAVRARRWVLCGRETRTPTLHCYTPLGWVAGARIGGASAAAAKEERTKKNSQNENVQPLNSWFFW